jgi:hypothetical protein
MTPASRELNVDGSRDKTDDCNNVDYNNNVED